MATLKLFSFPLFFFAAPLVKYTLNKSYEKTNSEKTEESVKYRAGQFPPMHLYHLLIFTFSFLIFNFILPSGLPASVMDLKQEF